MTANCNVRATGHWGPLPCARGLEDERVVAHIVVCGSGEYKYSSSPTVAPSSHRFVRPPSISSARRLHLRLLSLYTISRYSPRPVQRAGHGVSLHNRLIILMIVRRSISVLTDTRTVPKTHRHHYIQPIQFFLPHALGFDSHQLLPLQYIVSTAGGKRGPRNAHTLRTS